MNVPVPVMQRLERLQSQADAGELKQAVRHLQDRYREGLATSLSQRLTDTEALAYALVRMPATYGAIARTLDGVSLLLPDFQPRTLLDVGSGPGTAVWAAKTCFPSLEQVNAIEREPSMQKLAQALGEAMHQPISYVTNLTAPLPSANDLTIASYLLGELGEKWPELVDHLWKHTKGLLILIEPGTPAGFSRIRQAREQLLDNHHAHVVAPCPSDRACPINEPDWCHFAVRIPRSRIHRHLKNGSVPFEDEKMSYVVVAHQAPTERWSRVLRHPHIEKGHIELDLCTPKGLSHCHVTRQQPHAFRTARKIQWGDVWPQEPSPPH